MSKNEFNPELERQFERWVNTPEFNEDPAHDILHVRRVVSIAKKIATAEHAEQNVVIPAAWLHDVVQIPKSDPRRSIASKLSAEEAIRLLKSVQYDPKYFDAIAHAIECHSFSANKDCQTLEARVVQDADRLDGLGAIGIARCFATAGFLRRVFYSEGDPFCHERSPNDSIYTVDHFYNKLFKTAESLMTDYGRTEGKRRVEAMKFYLGHLEAEIS